MKQFIFLFLINMLFGLLFFFFINFLVIKVERTLLNYLFTVTGFLLILWINDLTISILYKKEELNKKTLFLSKFGFVLGALIPFIVI